MWLQGYCNVRIEPGMVGEAAVAPSGRPVATVEETELEEIDTVVGTLTSRKSTTLSAKVPAHVKKILVNPGDLVQAGDVLVILDDSDLRAKLEQARSGLRSARANLANARANFERHQKLLADGAVTRAAYDNAKAGYQMAQAGVEEAEKMIEELQVMMGYTRVTAPYAGVVVEKHADEGQLSAPGTPLISIQDPDLIRLETYIPESRRSQVRIGMKLPVRIETLDKVLMGTVSEIVPSADPRTRSFLVRVALPPDPQLQPGSFARLLLPSAKRKILTVPAEAVRYVGQLEMVTVLEDGRERTRMVRAGRERDGRIEILSGLEAGDQVVLPAEQ